MLQTIGIDEVGRGAWAGPLVVCAVQFNHAPSYLSELGDSKKLNRSTREKLAKRIPEDAWVGIGWVEPKVIDSVGLTQAMRIAILDALKTLIVSSTNEIIIDGNINYLKGTEFETLTKTIVKADQQVPSVMAASIVAKVARDQFMAKLDTTLPGYGFREHVGYGTKKHQLSLQALGVTEQHRVSYKPVRECL